MSTEAAPSLATAADLAAITLGNAPEPTPTIEPMKSPLTGGKLLIDSDAGIALHFPPKAGPDEKDSLGRAFDPVKFRPEKDSLGRWKNARAGRGGAKAAAAKSPETPKAPDAPPAETPPAVEQLSFVAPDAPARTPDGRDKFDLMADVYCRAFYSAADSVLAGKGEWAPDSKEEHDELRNALAAYLRMKGVEDLPPGPALAIAVATYAAKRIQRPNTATRLRLFVAGVKARFSAWRTQRKITASS